MEENEAQVNTSCRRDNDSEDDDEEKQTARPDETDAKYEEHDENLATVEAVRQNDVWAWWLAT